MLQGYYYNYACMFKPVKTPSIPSPIRYKQHPTPVPTGHQRKIPSQNLYLLPFQIINNHIPSNRHPPPPKPDHLALMRAHHSLHARQPIRNPTNKKQSLRLPILRRTRRPFPVKDSPNKPMHHAHRRIQHADVFAQDTCGSQRVERDGTGVAGFTLHEVLEERARAVIEGAVVWVVADTGLVEGDEDVDCGCWGFVAGF